MKRRILSSVVSLGLASTGSAALALDSVKGGATGVRLSEDFLVALEMGGIQLSALEEAKIRRNGAGVRFPIDDGILEFDGSNLNGEVTHDGGISLSADDGTVVSLVSFVIDTFGETPVITSVVSVNGELLDRLPIFELVITDSTEFGLKGNNGLKVRGLELQLSEEATTLLNEEFDVDLPLELTAGSSASNIRIDELDEDDEESEDDESEDDESEDDESEDDESEDDESEDDESEDDEESQDED
jgi:hypothetical protein